MHWSLIVGVATSLVGVTFMLNAWVINKLKPEGKPLKMLVSFGGASVISLLIKYVPPGAIVSVMAGIIGQPVEPIDLPAGTETLGWLGFLGVDVALFLLSGAGWDLSKIFGWRKSSK